MGQPLASESVDLIGQRETKKKARVPWLNPLRPQCCPSISFCSRSASPFNTAFIFSPRAILIFLTFKSELLFCPNHFNRAPIDFFKGFTQN